MILITLRLKTKRKRNARLKENPIHRMVFQQQFQTDVYNYTLFRLVKV